MWVRVRFGGRFVVCGDGDEDGGRGGGWNFGLAFGVRELELRLWNS
jgi:hypothetical protein